MEFLAVGVVVIAGLSVFFALLKMRQARRFQELGRLGSRDDDGDRNEQK